jgi:hypothetical protein
MAERADREGVGRAARPRIAAVARRWGRRRADAIRRRVRRGELDPLGLPAVADAADADVNVAKPKNARSAVGHAFLSWSAFGADRDWNRVPGCPSRASVASTFR